MQNGTDKNLFQIFVQSLTVKFMMVKNVLIYSMSCDPPPPQKKQEQSITYQIVRNKYDSEKNTVYFENENYLYLHHNGNTKVSHSYRDKVFI